MAPFLLVFASWSVTVASSAIPLFPRSLEQAARDFFALKASTFFIAYYLPCFIPTS
jgi:hypothetical protein